MRLNRTSPAAQCRGCRTGAATQLPEFTLPAETIATGRPWTAAWTWRELTRLRSLEGGKEKAQTIVGARCRTSQVPHLDL